MGFHKLSFFHGLVIDEDLTLTDEVEICPSCA